MKKTMIILFFIAVAFCKAQTPIISLTSDEYGDIENAYYKDTEGDLQELVGTWLYTNGNLRFN